MVLVVVAAVIPVIALLAFIAFRVVKDSPDRSELARLRTRDQDFDVATRELQQKAELIGTLEVEKAKLTADLENERRVAAEKLKLLQDAEARLKTEFENLANRIFEDKGKALSEQNRERMSGLLQPLKEQLESFRQRVDEVHKNDTEQSARLLEQVRQLQELSNKVSDEANNLAKAIKGDAKKQGDWGELIVERIFEVSGLERGREYDAQVSLRAEDGSLKRPDFIVYLPGDKAVIVDSKVSLTAFERFCSLDDCEAKDVALSEHLKSVRRHMEELSSKNYSDLLGNRTLSFVVMCIPLEPAFQAALQSDRELLYDEAKANVVVVGPYNLMATLKLIAQIWRRENENRNAEVIADRAGKLYDQVVLITDAMLEAQKKLGGVSESFELALKRLKEGRGNLVGRVEELRRLGAKVNRQLPSSVVEQASSEDDQGEPGRTL
ncbi:MAG: DNA recombination protein RmuC [Candidatus Eisenbacteria bacterium]|nr:DNA recombination protein RmuC [Candidatus Eisenbacteria bacterium]